MRVFVVVSLLRVSIDILYGYGVLTQKTIGGQQRSEMENATNSPTGIPQDLQAEPPLPTIAYKYAQVPSAFLSIVCSTFVVVHVVLMATKQHRWTIFHRLMIGLSSFDILSSVALILDPFFEVNTRPGHWTCTSNGFLKVTGVTCGSIYNAALSLHFFLVVCRQWRDNFLLVYFERPSHGLVGMFVVYWIVGIPLKAYNPSGLDGGGCWCLPYPTGCTLARDIEKEGASLLSTAAETAPPIIECTRGDPWGWIYDVTTTAGFITVVFTLISTNFAIYCTVRRQELRNQRHTFATSNAPTRSLAIIRRQDTDENASESGRQRANSKARQVASQSFLFCGGYLAVYIVTFVDGVATGGVQHTSAGWYPYVMCLRGVTFPLQGFFNCLVYIRPRFMQWRQADPAGSRCRALRVALSTTDINTAASRLRILRSQQLLSSVDAGSQSQGQSYSGHQFKERDTSQSSVKPAAGSSKIRRPSGSDWLDALPLSGDIVDERTESTSFQPVSRIKEPVIEEDELRHSSGTNEGECIEPMRHNACLTVEDTYMDSAQRETQVRFAEDSCIEKN